MFDNSLSTLMMEKSMSANWQRMQVIANNIANEDTPGYKAKRVAFESLLHREIGAKTNVTAFGKTAITQRIENTQPVVYDDTGTSIRADGNNVDIDSENMELARTQIQWNALAQKISGHYSNLRYVITGR